MWKHAPTYCEPLQSAELSEPRQGHSFAPMYSACLYCNARFAANEVVEQFAIGRRLAFDSARGRLWVVCEKCSRWNLSPLDERWEAIDSCERLFRSTPLRASTDHIGLAKLREGLELVRIGAPTKPEFAAWRYGREFAKRRRRSHIIGASAITMAFGYLGAKYFAPGLLSAVPLVGMLQPGFQCYLFYRQRLRPVAKLQLHDDTPYTLRAKDVSESVIEPDPDGGPWRLALLHGRGRSLLHGTDAEQVLGRIITHMNFEGGKQDAVGTATLRIAEAGSASAFLAQHAAANTGRVIGNLGAQAIDVRLAIEMALHEDTERVALEGDLAALEAAWKDAEQIAAIADRLLLPEWLSDRVDRLRNR